MRAVLLILCLTLPAAGNAAECPVVDPAAIQAARDPLFARLKASGSDTEGQLAASAIWQSWTLAPDARAQDLLDRGMRYIQRGNPEAAEELLDELVGYCPDYAEGWNQRAFARFLGGKLDEALADIDRTLELEPRHFGALAGRGLTLLRQGREAPAHQAIREAVAVHPWLGERHLLPKGEKI